MRQRTWRVLDYGEVVGPAVRMVEYECPCGHEAMMPVLGTVIAQSGQPGSIWSFVFDNDCVGKIPPEVQCRKCRRILSNKIPAAEASGVR